MANSARGWSNDPCGDEVGETMIGCVERREFGNRATTIGDDHFFSGPAVDVIAGPIVGWSWFFVFAVTFGLSADV